LTIVLFAKNLVLVSEDDICGQPIITLCVKSFHGGLGSESDAISMGKHS